MSNKSIKDHPWFETFHARPTAKYQVFIFPAAGTAGPYYRDWDKNFPEYEFSLIIYPGRAHRINEKLLTNINEYVHELDKGLLPYIIKPCIFIGHSIGTIINFALAKYMIETNNKGDLIKLLIEMGRGPPHLTDPDKSFARMSDQEIVEDLKRLADPKTIEIYNFSPFVEMLLPILKADAKVGEHLLDLTELTVPIIIYGGNKEENLKEDLLNKWIDLTTKKDLFRVQMFPGHHNFQSECQEQLLKVLQQDFNNILL